MLTWILALLGEEGARGLVAEDSDSGRKLEIGRVEGWPKRPNIGCLAGDDAISLRGRGLKPCFCGIGAKDKSPRISSLELFRRESILDSLLVSLGCDRSEFPSTREEVLRELVESTGSFLAGEFASSAERSR